MAVRRRSERSAVLALDQGTTSSRAVLFDRSGRALASAQREFPQIFPKPGWVEHDPWAIWSTQLATAREALARARLTASDVAAIGVANQRETTLLWDRRTGAPLHNAIVWQDRRTAASCDRLKRAGHGPAIRRATGLVPDPYFSASKVRWLLDHVPGARRRAGRGELAFGTVDSWLLWNLTGGAVHATDPGNASRTLLFNLRARDWDDDLLRLFGVPRELLPGVRPSSGVLGETVAGLFGRPIPIAGVAGDQQAALFGQGGLTPGVVKNTYGTGCFLLMNTGPRPRCSRHGLLSTLAWTLPDGTDYALEGSVFIGGAVIQWLRDGLGLIAAAPEIEALAGRVPDSGGVYLVPAFAGLGAPHWDPYARGTIAGLTRGTTAAHLARAALEAIAFQVADVLDVMRRDARLPIPELRADGGAAASNLLLQFQADLLQTPVVRPRVLETTALGAAFLAGLAVGFWKDRRAVARTWRPDRVFDPAMSADEAAARRRRWAEALNRARDWEEHG
jgi:glycerol kinase